jgi:hypothetical protein
MELNEGYAFSSSAFDARNPAGFDVASIGVGVPEGGGAQRHCGQSA